MDTSPERITTSMTNISGAQDTSPMSAEEEHELHAELPPLPGHKAHKCTDRTCCLVLLIAIAIQGGIGYYGFTNGDLRRLSRGYDYRGKLCGIDLEGGMSPDDIYLFHCQEPTSEEVHMPEPICVSACPSKKNRTSHRCFDAQANETREYADYDTEAVFNYCLPRRAKERMLFIRSKLGDYSVLYDNRHKLKMIRRLILGWIAMIKRAWLPLLLTANLALVVGYVYILALDVLALQLVYMCEILVTCGSWYAGYNMIQDSFSGDSGDQSDVVVDILLGFATIVFGVVSCIVSVVLNRRLPTAVGCLEGSCECIFEEPTLLLEPFLSLFVKAGVALTYIAMFFHLVSSGEMTVPSYAHNGFHREFSYTPPQACALVYTGFMFAWLMEICYALSQYTMVWTTQAWYFTPYIEGEKLDRKSCMAFLGYANAVRYHLGTAALGAILALLFRPLRVVLTPLAIAAKKKNRASGRSLSLMFPYSIKLYWSFLAKISKSTYMDVAITSSDYWSAAGRALDVTHSEVKQVSVLTGAQLAFQLALVGLTCYVGFFATMFMTEHLRIFNYEESPYYIEDPKLVAFVAAGLSGFIGFNFAIVLDTVGDTILYCYASEQRRHRKVGDLRDRDDYGKMVGYLSCWVLPHDEEDHQPQINYAPERLRNLIDHQQNTSDSDDS